VIAALAEAVAGEALLWRVTLTEFARWWRWRDGRAWSLVTRPAGLLEVQFDDWRPDYALGLEVVRGRHVATVPLATSRTTLRLGDLAYVFRPARPGVPAPTLVRRSPSLRAVLRTALDWETTTPLDELPTDTLPDRVKKGLRLWRETRRGRGQRLRRDEVVA
jgi:hypothetical protein